MEGMSGLIELDLPETFEMIASPSDDYPPFKSEDYEDGIPNLWPTQPTGFREIICEYNNLIREFSAQLIQLIAVGLGLKENAFENILNPFSGITLLKYPVYTGEDMPVGKGLHTDFSSKSSFHSSGLMHILFSGNMTGCLRSKANTYKVFTVLTQLTPHHGLQYQHPSSSSTSSPKFISIPHKPETLVIQAGQFLEILAAGMYKAVPHRVVNEEQPDDVEGGRLSVAYFADADPEAWIVPLGKEKREGRRAVEICEVLEGQPNYRRLACYGGK